MRNDFIRKVNRIFDDEEVKKIIFGSDYQNEYFLDDKNTMLKYFNNIMIFAFIFIFGKYRIWNISSNRIEGTGNRFLRVLNILGGIYEKNDLSFDIIESILMNIQLEGSNSQIKKSFLIEDAYIPNKKLSFFTNLAKRFRESAYLDNTDSIEERIFQLEEFMSYFRFMSEIKIVKEPFENIQKVNFENQIVAENQVNKISFVFNRETIDTKYTLIEIRNTYYFLESFVEKTPGEVVVLNYKSMKNINHGISLKASNQELLVPLSMDEYTITKPGCVSAIKDALDLLIDNNENDELIRDFYTINFKYIRNLALATADVLQNPTKELLKQLYQNEKNLTHLFSSKLSVKKARFDDENHYYHEQLKWDVILLILFIEKGASTILQTIFKDSPGNFKSLLDNLEVRYGKTNQWSDLIVKNCEEKAKNSLQSWQKMILNKSDQFAQYNPQFIEQRRDVEAELNSIHIIEILKEIGSNNDGSIQKLEKNIPISINSIIALINDISLNTLKNIQERTRLLKEILAQTLKTVYVFYEGFFEYLKIKQECSVKLMDNVLSFDEITRYQVNANSNFENKVRQTIQKISEVTSTTSDFGLLYLLDQIKLLVENCQDNTSNNSFNKLIKFGLGRNRLLDFAQIEPFYSCFDHIQTEEDFKELINFMTSQLLYLKQGNDDEGPIFPYIGSYEYNHQTKDGYDVCVFALSNTNQPSSIIKVLSEFNYKLNDKYLILPNQARSTTSQAIWIEPTIINYERFILHFENKQTILKEFHFSPLNNPKHYEKTAILIYMTDPYLYKDLFGSQSNAVKLLKVLFEDKTSPFHKNNYYIMTKDDEPIAVGGFFSKSARWNRDDFFRASIENDIVLGKSFELASNYYEHNFNSYHDSKNACNISVDPNYQKKGVATFLVNKFIEMSRDEEIFLTVLKSNTNAIELYKKCGFKITSEFDDYGDTEQNTLVACYEMRYIP